MQKTILYELMNAFYCCDDAAYVFATVRCRIFYFAVILVVLCTA
jgi:hypothetical protein